MKLSDIYGLPKPEEGDLGALALYMQNLAYLLEALLSEVGDPLDEFPNRPLIYCTNLVTTLGAASSGTDDVNLSVTWDADAPTLFIGDNPTPSDSTAVRCPANRTGLWAVGACANSFVAGTPNVNTWRAMRVRATGLNKAGLLTDFTGPRVKTAVTGISTAISDSVGTSKQQEPNSGNPGMPLVVDTVAWVPPDAIINPASQSFFTLNVSLTQKGNTSSTVVAAAGTAFLWAVWLGTGEQIIEQVGG